MPMGVLHSISTVGNHSRHASYTKCFPISATAVRNAGEGVNSFLAMANQCWMSGCGGTTTCTGLVSRLATASPSSPRRSRAHQHLLALRKASARGLDASLPVQRTRTRPPERHLRRHAVATCRRADTFVPPRLARPTKLSAGFSEASDDVPSCLSRARRRWRTRRRSTWNACEAPCAAERRTSRKTRRTWRWEWNGSKKKRSGDEATLT
mmetsp:Transcript_8157/g.50564  ORF Transcript_8157/g.50564 Transcript_8157/m.50564 type:complete len:209 (+) Transcript_8157:3405-4031(+)